MNTEPKLTDEQVEFVVGFINQPTEELQFLHKAIIEKAVMDRAVEEGYRRFDYNSGDGSSWVCHIRKSGYEENSGCGPTRFAALLAALMEARGR